MKGIIVKRIQNDIQLIRPKYVRPFSVEFTKGSNLGLLLSLGVNGVYPEEMVEISGAACN